MLQVFGNFVDALIVAGAASIIAVAIGLALVIWLAVSVICAVHYVGSHHG